MSHRTSILPVALVFAAMAAPAILLRSARASATAPVTVHSFDGYAEGASPHVALVLGADGTLYGATGGGGSAAGVLGKGTIFRITVAGTVTTLTSFPTSGTAGTGPNGFVLVGDGNFYGTAAAGGANGYGTVFKVTAGGALTALYSFHNGADGAYPQGLIAGGDGNLYGVTGDGGTGGYGTLFKIGTDGVLTTLHAFTGGVDGATPQSAPVVGSDGSLYGTTSHGGTISGDGGAGTVYRATTAGDLTTLHAFTGGSDGAAPLGALALASDGNFYGTTSTSTDGSNHGTVFRVSTSGVFVTLHAFTGGTDGDGPIAGLSVAADGNLYGTTHAGGLNSNGILADGTLFAVSTGGTFTTVATFSGGGTSPGPATPYAALTPGSDGNLYGTTVNGGASSAGTFFKVPVTGGHPAFFTGEVPLSAGVYYLTFPGNGNLFGYYEYLDDPHYIHHFDMGFEYVFDAADGNGGVYFYDFTSQDFFYTSPTLAFPYLYDFGLRAFLYYYPDPTNPQRYNTGGVRYFYNFATGQIISK